MLSPPMRRLANCLARLILMSTSFFVPESARWSALTGAGMNLGEALNIAGHAIEEANPRLDGVLTGANWNDEQKLGSPANRERIIRSLLNHFNALDLRDENLQEEGTRTW